MASWEIRHGDALTRLREMPDASVQTCITSPPYFGLRDYGHAGQIGLEPTPDEFVAALVAVFREVRRVLRDDGTLWLNLGDSYANDTKWGGSSGGKHASALHGETGIGRAKRHTGLKGKDLIGIPWLTAFALRADGWYLRSEIIWAKPNPLPESVVDRPTKAHEQVFLLTKSPRYFYDAHAIREPGSGRLWPGISKATAQSRLGHEVNGHDESQPMVSQAGANKRSVWTVPTFGYADAHFATFPPMLVEPMVLAGTPDRSCGVCGRPWERKLEITHEAVGGRQTNGPRSVERRHVAGGSAGYERRLEKRVVDHGFHSACEHEDGSGAPLVLDPFCGSGTTGLVAMRHRRRFVGIELNEEYVQLGRRRIVDDSPLMNHAAEAANR